MAKTLDKSTIVSLGIVQPGHVSQSVDAFTGIDAYDISLSGSLGITGSLVNIDSNNNANIDSLHRKLHDSSGVSSIDWDNRQLIDPSLNAVLEWSNNLTASSLNVLTTLDIGVAGTINGSPILTSAGATGYVTSVNGVFPSPGGNVSIALSATITGNSASLVVSSSGDPTGSLVPGTLWVISGDPTPANNGDAYIYTTSSITGEGQWLEIAPLDTASGDARYILKNGDDSHTGSLYISGSNIAIELLGDTKITRVVDSIGNTSLDPNSRRLYNSSLAVTLDWDNNTLYDNPGVSSINWQSRTTYDSFNGASIDWEARRLYDGGANPAIMWDLRQTYDQFGSVTMDWDARSLYDATGIDAVNWGIYVLKDQNNITRAAWGAGSGILYRGAGGTSLDWNNSIAKDGGVNNNISIDWTNRQLKRDDVFNTTILDWQNSTFTGSVQGTASWANNSLTASSVSTLTQTVRVVGDTQLTGSLSLSGSFAANIRTVASNVSVAAPGAPLYNSDYNVLFTAGLAPIGTKNVIVLPPSPLTGSVIYLQRVTGNAACLITSSIASHLINNVAGGYSFPTTLFTRRMFVFNGLRWYVEP